MIPVICTTPLEPELIHEFLVETYNGYPEAAQCLVLITTTDWSQYENDEAKLDPEEAQKQRSKVRTHGGGPMRIPSRPPWSADFKSPFFGQTPEDVAKALRGAENVPGHLTRDYCIILDRQTIEDRTVVLMKTRRAEGENLPPGVDETSIVKVRETFREANGVVASASAGVSSLSEILWNQHASKTRK